MRRPLSWANTELVTEDAVSAVRRMKEERIAPIRTMGSISLATSLVAAGLADYVQVTIFPVVTGKSGLEPLFAGWPDLDLDLVRERTFDGRMKLLTYVPTSH